jgi:hypothetical protein
MERSRAHHRNTKIPWVLWALWNPIDAFGCRNEATSMIDHAKVMTSALILAALVLHTVGKSLLWWELLILGTLCFGSIVLYTALLKSGVFSGKFSESDSHSTVDEHKEYNEHKVDETITTIRMERDPSRGVDPT